jgi:hypothetical protein
MRMTMIFLKQKLTNNVMTGKLYTSEAWLRKRFVMDKKSPQDIAKECGTSVELFTYTLPNLD